MYIFERMDVRSKFMFAIPSRLTFSPVILWKKVILYRRSLAVALLVTSIINVLYLYTSTKNDIQIPIRRKLSANRTTYKLLNTISESQTSMPSSRQIHMHFYNPPSWFENVDEVFKRCPSNCSMSFGKGQDYYDKDVVIFFSLTLGAYPVKKRRGQIWVFNGREPPPLHHRHFRKWRGLFNWTMTYRRDSDIPYRYGYFKSKFNPLLRFPNITFKRSLVHPSESLKPKGHVSSTAWFVSRCHAKSRREDYVTILNKTHYVDVFGRCGTNTCAKGINSQCLALVSQNYKFYLSFENSLCRDYITEKSFNFYIKTLDTVPITRGFGGMYSLYLPPGSYIDTSSYDHIDKLGHFLNYLSKNNTLYSRYFQWRNYYQADLNFFDSFCELCDRMHMPDMSTRYHRVYHNIHQWFFGSSNVTMCDNAEDLQK